MVKKRIDIAIAIFRFLKAARSQIKQGMGKEQILDFARREFGEISKLLRKQIDDLFKKKPTTKKGDVVPIKEEGIVATDKAKDIVKKRTEDIAKGDVTQEGKSLETSLEELKKAADELKKTTIKPENIMGEIVKGQRVMSDLNREGQVRTAVRWFMKQEIAAGRLKPINKFDKEVLEVPLREHEWRALV